MDWSAGLEGWTGALEWSTGVLEHWSAGVLELEMDYLIELD